MIQVSDPVQQQIDAYNERDLDGFVAAYAEDVVLEGYHSSSVRSLGYLRFDIQRSVVGGRILFQTVSELDFGHL
jgi:hypothetical protein